MNPERANQLVRGLTQQLIEAGAHGAVVYFNFGGGHFALDWGPHDDNLIAACDRISSMVEAMVDGIDPTLSEGDTKEDTDE